MPTPNIYFKALIAIIVCVLFFAFGFYVEHLRFVDYQQKVISDAKAQEQHNIDLEKQRALENEKTQSNYANQLANIRNYYNGLLITNSRSMPSTSQSSNYVIGISKNPISVASDCAETTEQLISLQQWVKDQYQIK
jgi:hypothetical protein